MARERENAFHRTGDDFDKEDNGDDENDDNPFGALDVEGCMADNDTNTAVAAAAGRVGRGGGKSRTDWGIPDFRQQVDRGVTVYTLPYTNLQIHLEFRKHSTGSDLWDAALVLIYALDRIYDKITPSENGNRNIKNTNQDNLKVTTDNTTATTTSAVSAIPPQSENAVVPSPPHLDNNNCNSNIRQVLKGKRVLELGAGTGAVGLYCAGVLGAQHVLLTDLPDNLPLLQRNSECNHFSVCSQGNDNNSNTTVSVAPLDWTDPSTYPKNNFPQQEQPNESCSSSSCSWDLIVGSDLLLPFAPKSLLLALVQTLHYLLSQSSSSSSQALICYEERFDCSAFFDYLNDYNLVVERIPDEWLHPVYQDPGRIFLLRITKNETQIDE